MVDRQDIDALLISALYGELTPADEARLTTHLESHPADKTVLADLTRTRATVRESRFLTVQLEPPQAVSAVLLQEASSHRPKAAVAAEQPVKESWFQRFIGSFARHPAMAAAAMLVVVVGVAGTMYMRHGDKAMMAEQTTSTFGGGETAASAGSAAPAPTAVAEQAKQLQQQAGSAYEADLAPAAADDFKATDKLEAKKDEAAAPRRDPKAVVAAPPRTYIGTSSKNEKPMDLEEAPAKPDPATASIADGTGNGNARRDEGQGRAPQTAPTAPSPAPGAARPQTINKGAAGGAAGGDEATRESENRPTDAEVQWARDQHVRVTNAVKANNCKEAASLALQLSNRAPAYYQQNVENDRSLKQCSPYINAERDKEAERLQRARALQKRNADEAKRVSPANTNSK